MCRDIESNVNCLQGNPVIFDEDGIREVDVLVMYQYQYTSSELDFTRL